MPDTRNVLDVVFDWVGHPPHVRPLLPPPSSVRAAKYTPSWGSTAIRHRTQHTLRRTWDAGADAHTWMGHELGGHGIIARFTCNSVTQTSGVCSSCLGVAALAAPAEGCTWGPLVGRRGWSRETRVPAVSDAKGGRERRTRKATFWVCFWVCTHGRAAWVLAPRVPCGAARDRSGVDHGTRERARLRVMLRVCAKHCVCQGWWPGV